ncbi:hypothetical protein [Nocardia sp. GAS34]|uniref:hypothetical protein n=1 Tax=unclassified Nocardia TaxID=2637762 RepID=UPI003D2516ED
MGESEPLRRRMTLEMLAEYGWDQIGAKDLLALERLIRMKQRVETPEPLRRQQLNGAWYALPTTDQAAVLDALDLIDPVPATMRMADAYAAMLEERCGDDRLPEIEEPEDVSGADPGQDLLFGAWMVSRRLSIDLSGLGPHTTGEGTGVMVLPRARQHPRHGLLPI